MSAGRAAGLGRLAAATAFRRSFGLPGERCYHGIVPRNGSIGALLRPLLPGRPLLTLDAHREVVWWSLRCLSRPDVLSHDAVPRPSAAVARTHPGANRDV